MAFGGLKGTLTGNGNSVTNPSDLSGSVSVAVGDLVYGVFGQQTALTAAGTVTDNLGNTYAYQNAGTDAGNVTGRPFWSRVTVAGTLTVIHVPATGSTNDYACFAIVIEGPFVASPLDAGNPANITSDVASPFTCPLSGTLAQAHSLVIGWGAADGSTVWAGSSPTLLGGNANNSTNIKVAVGYQKVLVTTSVSPAFTAAANPGQAVLGTAAFKGDLSATAAVTLAGLSRSTNATVDIAATSAKTLGAVSGSTSTTVDVAATAAKTLGTVTASATVGVADDATLSKTLGTLAISSAATVAIDPTLSKTLGALSLSSTATVDMAASLAKTLGAVTFAASATIDTNDAALNKTLGAVTSSSNAAVDVTSSADNTLGDVVAFATLGVSDDASLAETLDAAASSGAATVDVSATLDKTLDAVTLSGTAGGDGFDGTLAKTLGALSATGSATIDVQATLAKNLGAASAVSTATIDVNAVASAVLATLVAAAEASSSNDTSASLETTLGACVLSAYAQVPRSATGSRSIGGAGAGDGPSMRPGAVQEFSARGNRQTSGLSRSNTPQGRRR